MLVKLRPDPRSTDDLGMRKSVSLESELYPISGCSSIVVNEYEASSSGLSFGVSSDATLSTLTRSFFSHFLKFVIFY